MPSTSSCRCEARSYLHAHCYCLAYQCSGKAVSRSTYQCHRNADADILYGGRTGDGSLERSCALNESGDTFVHPDCDLEERMENEPSHEESSEDSSAEIEEEFQEDALSHKKDIEKKVVDAILNALPLKQQQGDSIKSFENWLQWAKDYTITDQTMKDIWPTSWSETEDILKKVGYKSPKHYFICMNERHHGEWDIMETPTEKCSHCGETGNIDYYYIGLPDKVKRWYGNPQMCSDMLDHWREKDHWYGNFERGQTQGWPIKKELWDGARFSQYSWFFNREDEWLLPTVCPHCDEKKVRTVIQSSYIALCEGLEEGSVDIICHKCRNLFKHAPKYAKGDPRNIVFLAHWDGFSPFGTTGGHSSGVIDVKIGNMSKEKRSHADQVFVVGFVPCFLIPDQNPAFLDPFLSPLIDYDIVDGFISGTEVEYVAEFPEFNIMRGPALIRYLILLWTGDHPGQCEVTKFKRQGKKPCRRCHVCGMQLEPGSSHYYYGSCRYHARYRWQERNMEESLPTMYAADEEEGTARKRLATEHGINGLSKLVTLYYLYGFDVLHDCVIDLMHNLPMNPVKKHLTRWIQTGNFNKNLIEERLSSFPWTPELKASRYPSGITSRLGYWKAEDLQKFAYPASEVIVHDLMSSKEFECWKLLVQMIQMVFNCCRDSGWRNEDIEVFEKLAWRHNILVEEHFGLEANVITEHNLIHVSNDILRFSSPDNYWVFDLERAVKRYVNQSSNHRNIEKTYSESEVRREVLQNVFSKKPSLTANKELEMGIKSKQVSSLQKGHDLISYAYRTNNKDVKSGIMIGSNSKFKNISDTQRYKMWQDLNTHGSQTQLTLVPHITLTCNRLLKPGSEFKSSQTKLYRTGENAMFLLNNEERAGRINDIHSITLSKEGERSKIYIYLETQLYVDATDGFGQPKYHSGTQSKIVHLSPSIEMINSVNVLRKAIMFLSDETTSPSSYVLIDFQSPILPISKQCIVVPYYPEKDDMVCVLGENDAKWVARVISIQREAMKVGVYFLKKHPRWPGSKKYIKESSTIHSVHWDCIIKTLEGTWSQNGIWQMKGQVLT